MYIFSCHTVIFVSPPVSATFVKANYFLFQCTFDQLTSVFSMEISIKFVESLPKEIFKEMRQFQYITFVESNFTGTALHGDLFKDNVELITVNLSNNRGNMTSLPNGLFANLTRLTSVL